MAFTAHESMRDHIATDKNAAGRSSALRKFLKNGGPTVMTVAVQGQRVFFGSSIKGNNMFYDRTPLVVPPGGQTETFWKNLKNNVCPAAIEAGLVACGMAIPGTDHTVGHMMGGSCGEVTVGWALCETTPSAQMSTAKVVAVEFKNNKMVIKDPCGTSLDDAPVSFCNLRTVQKAH